MKYQPGDIDSLKQCNYVQKRQQGKEVIISCFIISLTPGPDLGLSRSIYEDILAFFFF